MNSIKGISQTTKTIIITGLISCLPSISMAGPFDSLFPESESISLNGNSLDHNYRSVVNHVARELGIETGAKSLVLTESKTDDYSDFLRYQQKHNGLKVLDSQIRIQANPFDGSLLDLQAVKVEPVVAASLASLKPWEAVDIATEELKFWIGTTKIAAPIKATTLFHDAKTLAYKIRFVDSSFQSFQVYIDAHRGTLIEILPESSHALRQEIWDAENWDMEGFMKKVYSSCDITGNAPPPKPGQRRLKPCTNSFFVTVLGTLARNLKKTRLVARNDRSLPTGASNDLINAHKNTAVVYDYFLDSFNRKGIDGRDTPITSVINVGKNWLNAAWAPAIQGMIYGNGDQRVTSMTEGLDVIGHELTHAVISHSSQLVNIGQSGALNESFADFFGKMVEDEPGNWRVGSKIFIDPKKAIRNMEDPIEFGDPDHMAKLKGRAIRCAFGATNCIPRPAAKCSPQNDFCFIHSNAGIPSKAAVESVAALGRDFTQQVYYKAMTQYLTSRSSFQDAANNLYRACLIVAKGEGKDEVKTCEAISDAWKTVGITVNKSRSSRFKVNNPIAFNF